MTSSPIAEREPEAQGATPAPSTQALRMRAAVAQAVSVGPGFLRGDIDADHMAHTMVRAVRSYLEQERAAGGDGKPQSADARELQDVLDELMRCGSGYLAGRCDAACVGRTMTHIVGAFGPH